MDLRDQLLESSDRKQAGAGKFSIASIAVHGAIVGAIVFIGASATHKIDAETKPIRAFVTTAAAPPPPPPPPPPAPAASSAPRIATPKPVVVHETPKFVQPTETPQEVPQVVPTTSTVANVAPSTDTSASSSNDAGGVPGGVAGGVQGGVDGGVVGGQIGGVVGGQLGGVIGGTPGGTVGGTGTGTGKGDADVKPAEPPSDGPLRVGGDVKAPVVIKRAEPKYNELARHSRVQGVVIVEAVIDKNGNVDKVNVLKGLPMGLSEAAVEAVKEWKFKPATLNGEPVDVIFNLTVNFTLQ